MDLPVEFLEKYEKILGDEFPDFLVSFDEPAVSGFRVNPLKNNSVKFDRNFEAIPDSKFGYYGKVSGKSPEHVTGLVYSQEPAAQRVGELAAPAAGSRVLDLCAAPGGKSTHLLSYLNNTGLLVANEISAKRAKILSENIERFGARNVVVLNETPSNLTKRFAGFFDQIVLDAPCSGEGMFRKDPAATQYWHAGYPAECAVLQREIMAEAMKMLAPAGELIYATCTWAPEEDEDNVAWLLAHYPDLELISSEKYWPQRHRGEGQFVAKFRDTRAAARSGKAVKPALSNLTGEQRQLWTNFASAELSVKFDGILQVFGEQLYLLPQGLPDLKKLRVARNGLHLGTFKKKRFEPSFALGLALKPTEVKHSVKFDSRQFSQYVAGETVKLAEKVPNGWYQILLDDNGLGFAKIVDSTVKNYFPKGLRFHS